MRAQASGRGLHNVPAELTSFVGRRRELAEIKQRLGSARLVTLTGPGGVGKTRLAARAAVEMARAFPDGVWMVPLAAIQDAPLVTQAVFEALGLQGGSAGWSLTTLTDYLEEKHLLLILDNCEHLLDSCAIFATTLLKACPDLGILATTRQPLGTAGESRMPVPPMSLPEKDDEASIERLMQAEALQLLSERAAAVVPGFVVDTRNAATVLSLCRRLDGIPLALELAAVRLGSLTLDQLNQGLAHELAILGRGNRGAESRHQTLEATIGWSYGLLEEPERLLWARLSVFAGGFEQDAAIAVCSDSRLPADRLADLLGSLVEKSIVKREVRAGTTPRYWLLETLRQYGRQRLRDLGEETSTQERHLRWIAALAKSSGAFDRQQVETFARMHLERDNLWAALEYCRRQPGVAGNAGELAQHLVVFWTSRGPYGEVRRMVTSLAELSPENSRPRAQLLLAAAAMASAQNDIAPCAELSHESLRIASLINDTELVALSLTWVAAIDFWVDRNVAQLVERSQAALSLARSIPSPPIELIATWSYCQMLLAAGELAQAVEMGEQGLRISKERGELFMRGYLLNILSQVRWQQGERQLAEALATEGATCKHALDDRLGLQALLETLAWMAAERGAHPRAATLLGCAENVRLSSGMPLLEAYRQQHERSLDIAVSALGQKTFDAAHERGLAMTIDEGVAFAVESKEPMRRKPQGEAASESPTPLTRREREITKLVAEGLSNKQIAARLVVSERTAESHILNILNKLGFNSRAQIAAWASAQQAAASAPKG